MNITKYYQGTSYQNNKPYKLIEGLAYNSYYLDLVGLTQIETFQAKSNPSWSWVGLNTSFTQVTSLVHGENVKYLSDTWAINGKQLSYGYMLSMGPYKRYVLHLEKNYILASCS